MRLQLLLSSTIQQTISRYLRLIVLLLFVSFFSLPVNSQAATFTVLNNNDSGSGSLRETVMDANVLAGADIINFDPSLNYTTITLAGSEIDITDSVTISGPANGLISVNANDLSRHFNAGGFASNSGKSITLENLALSNGSFVGTGINSDYLGGGSIIVKNADLTLNNVTLNNNHTNASYTEGGAIYVRAGVLTINNSTLSSNSTLGDHSSGGAAAISLGTSIIRNTTIKNNSTFGTFAEGGGVTATFLTLENCLITGNSTFTPGSKGGGLKISRGNIVNSKILNNHTNGAGASGGGIYITSVSTIDKSIISSNKSFGSSASGGGIFTVGHTTISDSTISNNKSMLSSGGGIDVGNNDLTLNQSTVSKNFANLGGGISALNNSSTNSITITLNSATIVSNTATQTSGCGISLADIFNTSTSLHLFNSILAHNCNGTNSNITVGNTGNKTVNLNYSLFGDPLSEVDFYTFGTTQNNNPDLGPLQFNGGPIPTHKPNTTSPAVNTGFNPDAAAFTNDQRGTGFNRFASNIDIGAVELQNVTNNGVISPLNTDEVLTRRDMAREFLKALENDEFYVPLDPNNSNEPYTVQGNLFTDISLTNISAVFIEEFKRRGFTEGCILFRFCPNTVVKREEIAKIFLHVKNGASFTPTSSSNHFTDVSPTAFNAQWINELADTPAYTAGCEANKFCPKEPVTRQWFNSLLAQLP